MDKRQQIIESTIQLFATTGYEKTSIAAICAHSQVSKGLVFHHFKNKEGLLREVFKRMAEIINDVSGNHTAVDSTLSPKDRLVNFLQGIFASMASPEQKLYYQFDFQVLCQPSARSILKDLLDERYQLMMRGFQGILCEIPAADPIVDSHMLIAEIDGIALNYLFSSEDYPLTAITDRFIEKQLALLGL